MHILLKFTNFLKDRRYALEDLEQFAELVEPITHPDGWRGYRMKPLTQADRVTQRCKVLIHFTCTVGITCSESWRSTGSQTPEMS